MGGHIVVKSMPRLSQVHCMHLAPCVRSKALGPFAPDSSLLIASDFVDVYADLIRT